MVRVCSYYNCSNSYDTVKNIRMFSFPKDGRCQTWLDNCGNRRLIGLSPFNLHRRKKVCEAHFKKEFISQSGRLMANAVPMKYEGHGQGATTSSARSGASPQGTEESDTDSLKSTFEDTQTKTSAGSEDVDDKNQRTSKNSSEVQEQHKNKGTPTTSQPLRTYERGPKNSKAAEPIKINDSKSADSMENQEESIDGLADLKSIVKRLDDISGKLAPAILGDSFDHFGRYLSSLLRGLPPKKVLSIKKKFVSEVLDALQNEERETYKGKLFVENRSVATQVPDPLSNKRLPRGKVPVILPSQAMPTNPFKLLSVINVPPKTVYPNPRIPFVSTIGVDNPLIGSQISTSDSVRTISSSSEGTLIEVKLPNRVPPAVRDSLDVKSKKTPPKSHRKRKLPSSECPVKRFQTSTSAVLANSVSATDGSSNTDAISQASTSAVLANTVSATDGSSNTDTLSQTSASAVLANSVSATDGSSNTDAISQPSTSLFLDSTVNATDDSFNMNNESFASVSSILANTASAVNDISNMDLENTEEEFKIEIEEGEELQDIKEDPSTFETVLCTDNTYLEVKEEAPDEPKEKDSQDCGEDVSDPDQLLICDMCSISCTSKEDMIHHFTMSHSGCVPTLKLNPKDDTESTLPKKASSEGNG